MLPSKPTSLQATTATTAPYGSWKSPLTAEFITEAGVNLGSLSLGPTSGDLFWIERRPQEGGRQVFCRRAPGESGASERGAVDVTPAGTNVRTRVHEYGGGQHVMGADPETGAEFVVYSDFKSQRLFKLHTGPSAGGGPVEPVCLTPESEAFPTDALYRFADGVVDAARNRLVCVREDHTQPEPANVKNAVVAVALDGSGAVEVLAEGADFFAAPRVSPDGLKLAYITWDHPSMPWDATALKVAELDATTGRPVSGPETTEHATVAGGDGGTSVLQPAWSPKTGELFFVSDASASTYWNLFCVGGPEGPAGSPAPPLGEWAAKASNVLPRAVDFSGAAPGWQLGQQGYSFCPDGRVLASVRERGDPRSKLLVLGAKGGHVLEAEYSAEKGHGLPFSFGGLSAARDGTVYLLGTAPDLPAGVYEWKGLLAASGGGGASSPPIAPAALLCSSMKASMAVDPKFISKPQIVEFPTEDSAGTGVTTAFGYYYPPCNGDYSAPEGERPPCLVKAHGGPTACTGSSFNPGIQFWTSRGFAVVDVDYRGSTGYGRPYRAALQGNWGIVDIEDVCAAAQHLAASGKADPKRLCIDGGSAGGFTTLGALAFRDVFRAGCSLYGVADCSALAADTHKFESRYLDGLIGRYPEEKAKYDARSALFSAETLSCPVLLLQGDEDKIVPPNQAETMHAKLLEKGIPTALKMYQGEQHGFRQAPNIQDALNSELFFYSKVFGFEAPGVPAFKIDNLE